MKIGQNAHYLIKKMNRRLDTIQRPEFMEQPPRLVRQESVSTVELSEDTIRYIDAINALNERFGSSQVPEVPEGLLDVPDEKWEVEEDVQLVDNCVILGVMKKAVEDSRYGRVGAGVQADALPLATAVYRSMEPMKMVMRTFISDEEFEVMAKGEAKRLGINYDYDEVTKRELVQLGRKRALLACLEDELSNECCGGPDPIQEDDALGVAWLEHLGLPLPKKACASGVTGRVGGADEGPLLI